MPLADLVTINISTVANGVTQQGFGIPLILSHDAWASAERVRTYTSSAGVLADFSATSPTYLAAVALFSQNPAPPSIMVGKSTVKPTQIFVFKVLSVAAGVYSIRCGSQTATFTANGSDTNDTIVTGLVSAINALAAPALAFTAAATGTVGSKVVTLTGNAAGNWLGVQVLNTLMLSMTETTADPGITTDLAAIALASSDWYGLLTLFSSSAIISAAAAWTETNNRLYVARSSDTPIINDAQSLPATDIAHVLKAANYVRTALIFTTSSDSFAAAAWDGEVLPDDPGSETWMFKTLVGVVADTFTATQIANLKAKNCNFYYVVAGESITSGGMVADGEFIDVVRFRDWLAIGIQEDVFAVLKAQKKVAYTDKGTQLLRAAVVGRMQQGEDQGGLSDNPKFQVNVAPVAGQSSSDKTNRIYRGLTFTGTLAGAIHTLVINGTLTV